MGSQVGGLGSGRQVQLYLAHTTANFVFYTLLQAFQLVL